MITTGTGERKLWFTARQPSANPDAAKHAGTPLSAHAATTGDVRGGRSGLTALVAQAAPRGVDGGVVGEGLPRAAAEQGRRFGSVQDPTTWSILQHDGPNHLGLWCNAPP